MRLVAAAVLAAVGACLVLWAAWLTFVPLAPLVGGLMAFWAARQALPPTEEVS